VNIPVLMARWLSRYRSARSVAVCLLALWCMGAAIAAEDVGVVMHVGGEVVFSTAGQNPERVKAYMRLREGDQLSLSAGGTLKLVFFEQGRVETWNGPARFSMARAASLAGAGMPEVSRIPVLGSGAPQLEKIGRFSRAGGIVLRSTASTRAGGPEPESLSRARAQYAEWVAQAAPDDILPDLYLLAVLQEHRGTDEVFAVIAAMEKKQPGNADLQELTRFLRGAP
jgi:hypothetical protein